MEKTKQTELKTPRQVKQEFAESGKSIAEWARENKFPPNRVYRILDGNDLGIRGMAFQIRKALGIGQIKPGQKQ